MLKAPPCVHWLLDIARADGIVGSEEPSIDATTRIEDAWRIVAGSGGITQAQLAKSVGVHFHLAIADFATSQPRASDLIPEKLARERLVFPLRETDHQLVVATANPNDIEAEDLITFASGRRVMLEIAPPVSIQKALDERYVPDRDIERLLKTVGTEMANAARVVQKSAPEAITIRETGLAATIQLTNLILGDAVHARASDIHIEPAGDGGRIRFRVDG
ncbi:MAG: hypothetical protein ABSA57_12415, partial [Candidatus Acidiferrales bacterium]